MKVREVGESGFEPPASCSQSRRADQAALHPDSATSNSKSLTSDFRDKTIITKPRLRAASSVELELFQLRFEEPERFGPVADSVFYLRTELGEGLLVTGRYEKRVVAETT